jgi:AraC family transcriptional regulator
VLAAGDGAPDGIEGQSWELLAAMAGCADGRDGTPPRWVVRACERLHEEAAPLARLAAEQGVHPVYFARAFARWVGCPPSVFRARAQLQRALAQVAAGVPLATAALHGGFADQAHFSRVARQHCGAAPARLRALLA